jgi:hypothetical protein
MSFNRFGEIIDKMFSGNLSIVGKIFVSLSIIWILSIGYLIWWNSIISPIGDKSFRWDEWIWFGVAPAIVPYLFYFVWKKNE